jgi:hypothetical protein
VLDHQPVLLPQGAPGGDHVDVAHQHRATPVRLATDQAIEPSRVAPRESAATPDTGTSTGSPAASAAANVGTVPGSTPTTRASVLERGGDPGHQPASAHRDEHRVDRAVQLVEQLQRERALPGADLGWS